MKDILKLLLVLCLFACDSKNGEQTLSQKEKEIAQNIKTDKTLRIVYNKAKNLIKSGFNAGTGYNEVWIRDYNTFINLSCDLLSSEIVQNNLLLFFKFQQKDGNIVDGYVTYEKKPE